MNEILRGSFDPNSGLATQGDDNKVFAEFRMHPVVDGEASKNAGRTIKRDVPYIKIIQPGESRHSVYDQPATGADAQRFPRQWAQFQAGQKQEVIGSGLELLFPESPAIVENLNHVGMRTIEQLAAANDTAIQSIGLGGSQWREKAKAYLEHAEKGKGFHALANEIDQMKLKMRELTDRNSALETALARATSDQPEKRGPGRPRKQDAA